MIHDQWSACTARVLRPGSAPFELGGDSRYPKTSDITAGTVQKDIGSPAGGFSLTLQPFQSYLEKIRPNDWVEIFLSSGNSPMKSVMYGLVDRAARKRVIGNKGEEKEVIQVVGRDWGKVLLNTQLVFDPVFAQYVDTPKAIQSYFTHGSGTKQRIAAYPDDLVKFYLDQFLVNRQQFIGPSLRPIGSEIDRSQMKSSSVAGRVNVITNLNLNGVLWNLLEQNAVTLFNELYTDWDNGRPVLVLREYPYDRDTFLSLPMVDLPSTLVYQEDIGRGDHEVVNWIRVHLGLNGSMETGIAVGARLGYIDLASIKRHGLRRLEPTTNGCFPDSEIKTPKGPDAANLVAMLEAATKKVAGWYANLDLFYSGSMSCGLLPDARVGKRVVYRNERNQEEIHFYLESVTHQFTYDERSISGTHLQLTRGVSRDNNFGSLKTFDQLTEQGTLVALKDSPLWMNGLTQTVRDTTSPLISGGSTGGGGDGAPAPDPPPPADVYTIEFNTGFDGSPHTQVQPALSTDNTVLVKVNGFTAYGSPVTWSVLAGGAAGTLSTSDIEDTGDHHRATFSAYSGSTYLGTTVTLRATVDADPSVYIDVSMTVEFYL